MDYGEQQESVIVCCLFVYLEERSGDGVLFEGILVIKMVDGLLFLHW